jgi:hypothetical protein
MDVDPLACRLGLFQILFADMAEHAAAVLFAVRHRRDPGLQMKDVLRERMSDVLKELRNEVEAFGKASDDRRAELKVEGTDPMTITWTPCGRRSIRR